MKFKRNRLRCFGDKFSGLVKTIDQAIISRNPIKQPFQNKV